jgi:hypothetical protein
MYVRLRDPTPTSDPTSNASGVRSTLSVLVLQYVAQIFLRRLE